MRRTSLFSMPPSGEQRFVELRRGDLAQKVALVFAAVHAFVERGRAVVRAAPRVVAGGEVVRAEFCGVVRHFGEFDFAVAEDVRVGGASGGVFGEEVAEDALVVFLDEVHGVQRDAEGFADITRVFDVFFDAAVAAAEGFFPVFMKMPMTSCPACLSSQAVTAESTPPERPTTTR